MLRLPHEKLDAYRVSLELAYQFDRLLACLPVGQGYLRQQAKRAVASVTCNIAEGAGEFNATEKARFYRLALRSATESAALIDMVEGLGCDSLENMQQIRELLARVIGMLTKLIKAQERRARGGDG